MNIEAIKEALANMRRAASMHDSEWAYRMGEVNEWGVQCWEIDSERAQEIATAYGETTAAFIAACNPAAISSLIERLEAAELKVQELRGDHVPTPDDISAQDWSGMDGAIAYHLIDRHAENWSHIGRLMHAWRDAAIAAAKSAGELPPTDRSAETAAHPSLCAVDDTAAIGGLACDRLPFGVPPGGLEHQGNDASPGHKFNGGGQAGGSGVSGGLEAGRSGHGGLAEGVSDE